MKKVLCFSLVASLLLPTSSFAVSEAQFTETSIETKEFNQWRRMARNFTFNVSSRKKTEKAIENALINGVSVAVGELGGPAGAIAGGVVGGALSSVASDCVDEFYDNFDNIGYGTVVVGMYKDKLRIGVYVYKDAARTNLIYDNIYSINGWPV